MFRAMHYSKDGQLHTEVSLIDVAFALQEPESIVWADFATTPPEEDEPILRKTFNFHPLAIDDALQESHVPKIDDWGQYLYIVLHAVVLDHSQGLEIDTRELDIFIGKNKFFSKLTHVYLEKNFILPLPLRGRFFRS